MATEKIRYFLRAKISFSLANQKPRMIMHKNIYFPGKFSFDAYKINTIRSLVRYLVHTRNKFHISLQPYNILYLCRNIKFIVSELNCLLSSNHINSSHKTSCRSRMFFAVSRYERENKIFQVLFETTVGGPSDK